MGRAKEASLEANTTAEVVRQFWRLMATNQFDGVAVVLADDFELEWPQSGERILGAENFARMNQDYPSHGPWSFTVNQIVAQRHEAVSDVLVSDGVQTARAISFFVLQDGKVNG